VPEYIISKPGKLTPEEFEKMKIHPLVGAEILEQVEFPYPVVPIVRAHHEKWDGNGYPYGLKGEEIPIGARILAAVDCLDALASDRQYRKALPLDEAIARVKAESGTSFDPRVVSALVARYRELEEMARAHGPDSGKMAPYVKVERGAAPDAGFAESADQTASAFPRDYLAAVAEAYLQGEELFQLNHQAKPSLRLGDIFSILSARLKLLISHQSLAIFVLRDNVLVPEFVSGENQATLSLLRVPKGEGLVGWVAENNKSILNGNPAVEPGFAQPPTRLNEIRSALAVPLQCENKVTGVLALYRKDALFNHQHLRILTALTSRLGCMFEDAPVALKTGIPTTEVCSLPGLSSLFAHLERKVSRANQRFGLSMLKLTVQEPGANVDSRSVDEFLTRVSAALKEACREGEYLDRMSNDEFAIVTPELTEANAHDMKERMYEKIESLSHEVFRANIVDVNFGMARFPDDGELPEKLLRICYDRRDLNPQYQKLTLHLVEGDRINT
jgi:GGDEF domain-containing protein